MNCVGIDVSKGKSMIAVMRPFGEVVVSPFEVLHTDSELSKLAGLLKSLDGETRVVIESTGNYHAPVAWLLHDAGLYVSVVNAMLVHDYGNNSLRRASVRRQWSSTTPPAAPPSGASAAPLWCWRPQPVRTPPPA